MYKRFLIFSMILLSRMSLGQVTGFIDDFNDNILTDWEMPHPNTFYLEETDSLLKITYNRTATTWEWDNFNFIPPAIDIADHPVISVRVKSNVGTELTFKPKYQDNSDDWETAIIQGDEKWRTVAFHLSPEGSTILTRIYIYLDGGTTIPKSGVVFFDDLKIGDAIGVGDTLNTVPLENAIDAAAALIQNSEEGPDEGQFRPGAKSLLLAALETARGVLTQVGQEDVTQHVLDQAVWDLYDACTTFETQVNSNLFGLSDSLATLKTKYLYANLRMYAQPFLIFGMHDVTGYGVGWTGDDDRSDVKDVCGSYPALYSEDLNKVARNKEVDRLIYRLTSAFQRGGILTLCWHQFDPQGRSFYAENINYERVVETLLPGGTYHGFYQDKLRTLACFFKGLRGADGHAIPVIFRPYHEHLGDWFWWGPAHCTTQEFNQLWQFTTHFLRDSLNVHNLIYAFSPSLSHVRTGNDYFRVYPGDDYVDVFGTDDYFGSTVYTAEITQFRQSLQTVVQHALARNKLAALTEVGQEGLTTPDWFTRVLLDPLKNDSLASHIAYAAVWRNANETHHFAPYPGHSSVPDFLKFYEDPYTLFEDNLPQMYILPTQDKTPPYFVNLPAPNFTPVSTPFTLTLETSERASVRYSWQDEAFATMPYLFKSTPSRYQHSAVIQGEQGLPTILYARAMDIFGNAMDTSTVITFTIDTLKAPVKWYDRQYPDQDWAAGAAPLGYGVDDPTTPVAPAQTVYFRCHFTLAEVPTTMGLLVKCHDGAAVYVNGIEVGRVNLPEFQTLTYETAALSNVKSNKIFVFDENALAALRAGDNVIAVEVHTDGSTTADLAFDGQLFNSSQKWISLGTEWRYFDRGTEPPVFTVGDLTAVPFKEMRQPEQVVLYQNHPNPFNPVTRIEYRLPQSTTVRLEVFDMTGRWVQTLVQSNQAAGRYEVRVEAADLASGIYFYRLRAGSFSEVKKMMVLK